MNIIPKQFIWIVKENADGSRERFRLDGNMISRAIWSKLPKMITEPKSDDAKKNAVLRLALKGALKVAYSNFASFFPKLSKGDDIVVETAKYLIGVVTLLASGREWTLIYDTCRDCKEPVFEVRGLITTERGEPTQPQSSDTHIPAE